MTRTAIILGAGASADFGLPLGEKLFQLAMKKVEAFLRHPNPSYQDYGPSKDKSFFVESNHRGRDIASYQNLIQSYNQSNDGYTLRDNLAEMKFSSSFTIDKFVSEFPVTRRFFQFVVSMILQGSLLNGIKNYREHGEARGFEQNYIPKNWRGWQNSPSPNRDRTNWVIAL